MADYRTIIRETEAVIQRRAAWFRNQVIAVATVVVATLALALVTRSVQTAAGTLVLVPLCGAFLLVDGGLVRGWRSRVLAAWVRREVDLAALIAAIRAHPSLPTATVESMLATLPPMGELVAEQRVLSSTRRAIAAAATRRVRSSADTLMLRVVAAAIVVTVALCALWTADVTPLWGAGTLLVVPVAAASLHRRRRRACETEVARCRRQEGFSEPEYQNALARSSPGRI